MTPPDLSAWGRLGALLALEGLVLGAGVWGLVVMARSAVARRQAWQLGLLTLGLIGLVEWSGVRARLTGWRALASGPRSSPRMLRVMVEAGSSGEASGAVEPAMPSFQPAPAAAPLPRPVTWPGGLWLAGLGLSLGTVLWRRMALVWMARHSVAADAGTVDSVNQIRRRLGLGPVRVVAWPGLRGPIAYGILRPTVAVPAEFPERFDARERPAMLAHELAHLAGRDPLWLLVSDLVCALWWWHPVAWWARRGLRASSEEVADGASVLTPEGPGALAECLVRMARDLAAPESPRGLGVWGSGRPGELARRVRSLLDGPAPWRRPGRWEVGRRGGLALAVAAVWCAVPMPGNPGAPLLMALQAGPPVASAATAVSSLPALPADGRETLAPIPAFVAPAAGTIETDPGSFSLAPGLPFEPGPRVYGYQAPTSTVKSAYVHLRDVTPEELAAQGSQKQTADADAAAVLRTRSFAVNPAQLLAAIRATGGAGSAADAQAQVWEFFRQCGVTLSLERPKGTPPQESSAVYLDEPKSRLLVRGSMREIETVERVLDLLGVGANASKASEPVVTLTGYFAEIAARGSEDIGLDWIFGQTSTDNPVPESLPWPESRGTVERLRSEGQFAALSADQFRALQDLLLRRTGVDLLTAPKATTVSGRLAEIQVSEIRTVVTGLNARVEDAAQATGFNRVETGAASSPEIQYSTEQIATGPMLRILPEAAGDSWSLTLTAQLTEFLGYDDPGTDQPSIRVADARPVTATLPLPRLRRREATGQARVEPGGAVALRGPMVEERTVDKGGIFRRGTTNVVQKRLYVFVKVETGETNATTAAGSPGNPPVQPVIVRIPGGFDPYRVGEREVQDFEISGVLRSLALDRPGLRLIVCADWDAEWRRVAPVLEVVKDAGIRSVQVQRTEAPER
ncbi:MAG: hypothetical protein J0L84_09615 [Verrucomicrobia bacterium]|nr:hypothetical protein [Verrucomicrobiota bacterium]